MLRAITFYAIIVVAVPLAFFEPFSGLLIYLWISFGRPGDFVWKEYALDYTVWVAGAVLLGYLTFEMGRSPLRVKGMRLLLLLWVWLVLASVFADNPSVAYPKLWEYSRGFIMAFLTAALANSEKRVRYILYVLAISLGLLGAKGALDAFLTGFSSSMKGPGGMISEQNEYALALNMAIPILAWLSRDETRRWVRWALRAMATGSAIVVIGTWSRSGLLGLAMAGFILTIFSKRKLLLSAGVIVGFVALLVVGPEGALRRYRSIPTATEVDASAIGRLQAWETALRMTKAHPIFGVGLRNFELAFPQYSDYQPRVTHNVVFEMMSETGIPGCILFLAMILAKIFQMFRQAIKVSRVPGAGQLATHCQIIGATLAVYLVPNMFINRQDFDLMYQIVAVGAGLALVVRQRLAAVQQQAEPEAIGETGVPLALRGYEAWRGSGLSR